MTNTQIEMSEDEFDAQYPLLTNHLNPNPSWVFGNGRGCLFETYGEELEFVRDQDPLTIWTIVDGDDGDQCLLSGDRFVNRIGYLISTVPYAEAVAIQVRIESHSHLEEADESSPDRNNTNTLRQANPLLVPKGTPLIPGKMYLRLYHGRTDPGKEMDDWGFLGPTFGPLCCYVHTYCSTFRIQAEACTSELWLEKRDDMIRWGSCFFGDMEVFIAGTGDKELAP